MQFPLDKKYNIIYADPPWKFGSKAPHLYGDTRFHSLDEQYQTQEKGWIAELPVKQILHKDAACFMWTVDSHLEEALHVMRAWGFKFVNIIFIWEKISKKGVTCCNVAPWVMKNYEICLFGTKGAMSKYKKKHNIQQKIRAIRRKHSQKPPCVRGRITALFGDLPRIELFARERAKGWDAWGDECPEMEETCI